MKNMKNSSERENYNKKNVKNNTGRLPMDLGFSSKIIFLSHKWVENIESNLMANNTLKYKNINNHIRLKKLKYGISLTFINIFFISSSSFLYYLYFYYDKKKRQRKRL
jgi:hypothetical protein